MEEAKQTLDTVKSKAKQPWITDETLKIIERKHWAEQEGYIEKHKELKREAQRRIRKD